MRPMCARSFPSVIVSSSIVSVFLFTLIGCSEKLGEAVLTVNGHEIIVEIAKTSEQKRQGLMHRKSLPEDHGMLFVYDRDQKLSFWMKNTHIPLSIAFLSKDGTIKEIHRMNPQSEKILESTHYVRYALEVNRGLFDELGMSIGDKITIPPKVPEKAPN